MCGIHGFAWQDNDAAHRMVAAAKHRGPDGSGVWSDHRVTLGHNLLAVADSPDWSTQPWHHAGKMLTYNGEIYNYRELRSLLKHKCLTDSDTEVLAAGLHEYGIDFLRRVDGMFALAWYDPVSAELTLARDTNGARPLYGGFLNNRPAFSSEIRSLLALGFPAIVSRAGFQHYYQAGLVTGPLTMFEGIYRLVPGEVITFQLDAKSSKHSNLNAAPPPFTAAPADIPEMLRAKLRQAVSLTLTGRRQIGLFLSGGMDSSAIYYELCESLKAPPRSFTSRFVLPHDRCPHNGDADAAAMLTQVYKTKHRESVVSEQQWVDNLRNAVLAMEEPRQGKSYAAYYACNQLLAKFGCVVTLSGDGGDELLMGYKHQHNPPYANRIESLRPRRQLRDPSLQLSLEAQTTYLKDWLPEAGLTGDAINDFMYAESLTTLAEDFLVRNDKLGSAFSLESRFPMMCSVFRDFCRSIPGHLKANTAGGSWGQHTKPLLRAAYDKKLPAFITEKKKTGWRAPTDDWLVGIASHPATEGPAREYVRETLRDPQIRELFEITNDDVENRYLNNRDFVGAPKTSGKPSVGPGMVSQKELFSVLMFAAWFKAFNMRLWS